MFTRRIFTTSAGIAVIGIGLGATLKVTNAETRWLDALTGAIGELEKKTGGRLGVALLDMSGGASMGYRESERFPMCSTFKVLAAGALLARVDAGRENCPGEFNSPQLSCSRIPPVQRTASGEKE
jgi:beta-lactamase class A